MEDGALLPATYGAKRGLPQRFHARGPFDPVAITNSALSPQICSVRNDAEGVLLGVFVDASEEIKEVADIEGEATAAVAMAFETDAFPDMDMLSLAELDTVGDTNAVVVLSLVTFKAIAETVSETEADADKLATGFEDASNELCVTDNDGSNEDASTDDNDDTEALYGSEAGLVEGEIDVEVDMDATGDDDPGMVDRYSMESTDVGNEVGNDVGVTLVPLSTVDMVALILCSTADDASNEVDGTSAPVTVALPVANTLTLGVPLVVTDKVPL
jgi:hypothetical protein